MTTDPQSRVMGLVEDLYPICRSIMGPGVRRSLDLIAEEIPIERGQVASGTPVLDWVVPDEWEIRDAFVSRAGESERLVDFGRSNLHVVSHSVPIDEIVDLEELQQHLYSLPDHPEWIPYRTSYYTPQWGFCLADADRRRLQPGPYRVVIDASLRPGALEWGELVVPGASSEEVLISTHICHPSLANDNVSGIVALVELARHLLARADLRYTYRLLFLPGTIGSIAWLAQSTTVDRVAHGLVLTGLGDSSPYTYKASRRGDAEIDRVLAAVLASIPGSQLRPFSPYGYDERQFCSPGFDLPVGRLTRGVHGEYPEYHTSADDLDFIGVDQLDESVDLLIEVVRCLEANRRYVGTSPYGEPQLGRRGLYSSTGGAIDQRSIEMAYLWVLSGSDGHDDLAQIALRAGLRLVDVCTAAERLRDVGLLERAP